MVQQKQQEWDGSERRAPETVLIAIMNHVQESLDAHKTQIDRRFDALFNSLNSYLEKQDKLERAFLKTEDDELDIEGHYHDHYARRKWAQFKRKVQENTLSKLIEWASILFVAWAGVQLWKLILEGPK